MLDTYRNQQIDLHCKSLDWFLYDGDLSHERLKGVFLCECPEIFYKN